ncbi:MAG: CapA family protein [Candidatus Shapirobacteria bacterium]
MRKFWLLAAIVFLVLLFILNIFFPKKNIPVQITLTASPVPTLSSSSITLLFTGDLSLSREINYQVSQKQDPDYPFEKIKNTLAQADWVTASLEGPIIENCPILRTGYKFCGQTQNANGLASAGIDSLNLANNHINNFGPEGIDQTIRTLDQKEINYFGLGKVNFQTIRGIKLGFLGFDDTVSPLIKDQLQKEISKISSQVDWLIINFHWGQEYQDSPNSRQRELAYLAVESGADIVVGHHPHVVQALEYYRKRPVFYSLGNFVFDQLWSEDTRKGALGKITLTKERIIKAELIPIYINNDYQPELVNP